MKSTHPLYIAKVDGGGGGDPDNAKPKEPADPADPDGDPQAKPKAKGKPKSAVDVVKHGTKTPREIKLEQDNAKLEDELSGTKEALEEANKIVSAAKEAPGRKKGKSILDEIQEFIGTKPDHKPPADPCKKGALEQVNEILGLD